MKLINILICTFVTCLVVSCTDDELLPEMADKSNTENKVVFTIEDWKTETETRTYIQFGGYSLWNSWPYGTITVVPKNVDSYGNVAIKYDLNSLTTYGPANEAPSSLSTKANSGWNMKNGVEYVAYYPSYTNSTSSITFNLDVPSSAQLNSSYMWNVYNDMMYATAKAGASSIEFKFKRKYSLLGVCLTGLPAKKWKKLTVANKNGDKVFCTSGTLNVKTGKVTPNDAKKFSSYSFSCPTTTSSNSTIYAVFQTLPTTTGEILCVLEDADGNEYETTFASKSISEGYWNYWSGSVKKSDCVDLGLPSGLKWATMNIGATSVTDFGNYYAWGETKGYGEVDPSNATNYNYCGSYVKTYFDWSTYKWCNGKEKNITKYHNNSYCNDNKETLDPEDDAATQNWGERWRMPTIEDVRELVYNTHSHWVDNYNGTGVSGYIVYKLKDNDKFTGSCYNCQYTLSDTHVFFPAAGYRSGDSVERAGELGVYLTSSTMDHMFGDALHFDFNWVERPFYYFPNTGRCYGRTIRAVCD